VLATAEPADRARIKTRRYLCRGLRESGNCLLPEAGKS
jgi:hypothetical protein